MILRFLAACLFVFNFLEVVAQTQPTDSSRIDRRAKNTKDTGDKLQREIFVPNNEAIFTPKFPNQLQNILSDSLSSNDVVKETTITLLLSFDAGHAAWKMSSSLKAEDAVEARGIKLKESSVQAMDFYEGFSAALNEASPFFNIHLQVFEAPKSDSLLRELLKNDSITNSDIIIGPGTISGARIISEFCKKNKIINIQPFIAARNIGGQNPYLVKLAPSIEAHMGRIFKTIVDSFSNYKTVIYCSKRERDFVAATAIDTLFKEYNLTAKKKLNFVFVNNGDTTKSAAARSLGANVTAGKTVIVYCSYDPSTVEQTLKSFQRGSAIVFGMPTWINEELIRVDYMNNADLHFTDEFYADTTSSSVKDFEGRYVSDYVHNPSQNSFLGYDVAQFLMFSLKLNGYNFAEKGLLSPYTGLGYSFRLKKYFSKGKSDLEPVFQYYTNDAVHQYRVQDYKVLLSE